MVNSSKSPSSLSGLGDESTSSGESDGSSEDKSGFKPDKVSDCSLVDSEVSESPKSISMTLLGFSVGMDSGSGSTGVG